MAEQGQLRISEIFYSLQGESSYTGMPTVFIRLTGCPLRCGYCDTAYAFTGGTWQAVDAILLQVKDLGAQYVCVTGGGTPGAKILSGVITKTMRCRLQGFT